MSKFSWLTAIVTFLIGTLVNSLLGVWQELPKIEVDTDYRVINTAIDLKGLTGEIEIEYAWSLIGREALDGQFKVTNRTHETIYYPGYEKNHHALNWIKQGGKFKIATALPYWDDIKTQSLKPYESAYFSIPVPQNNRPFQAGFDFRLGKSGDEQRIWVDVPKQIKSLVLTCNDKRVTPGSILAETCLTPP